MAGSGPPTSAMAVEVVSSVVGRCWAAAAGVEVLVEGPGHSEEPRDRGWRGSGARDRFVPEASSAAAAARFSLVFLLIYAALKAVGKGDP